jgi:hypothetical protein
MHYCFEPTMSHVRSSVFGSDLTEKGMRDSSNTRFNACASSGRLFASRTRISIPTVCSDNATSRRFGCHPACTKRPVNIEANTVASVSPLGWMIHKVSRFFSLASRAREEYALNNERSVLCSLCDMVRGLNRSLNSNSSFSAFAVRSCWAAKSVCSFIALAFVVASSSACRLRTTLSVNTVPSPVRTVPATNTVVNTWNAVFQSSTVQDHILIVCALILSIIVIFGAGFAVATILWFHLTRTDRDD